MTSYSLTYDDMASLGQHRYFHGILLKEFMIALDIEVTRSNMEVVKKMFKSHLAVKHTSELDDRSYSGFIDSVALLIAEQWGIELPVSQEMQDMKAFIQLIYTWKG